MSVSGDDLGWKKGKHWVSAERREVVFALLPAWEQRGFRDGASPVPPARRRLGQNCRCLIESPGPCCPETRKSSHKLMPTLLVQSGDPPPSSACSLPPGRCEHTAHLCSQDRGARCSEGFAAAGDGVASSSDQWLTALLSQTWVHALQSSRGWGEGGRGSRSLRGQDHTTV